MHTKRSVTGSLAIALALAATAATAQEYSDYRGEGRTRPEHGTSPGDSARPGERFFYRAVEAEKRGDTGFAADMFRVAASWAYKPAQYNLGIMYFKGEGVAQDKALGMAWLALAAERSEDHAYAAARAVAYAEMSADEFARANVLWREMRRTYGDATALRRAQNRWLQTRAEMTGSRVGGGTGPLAVGGRTGVSNPRTKMVTAFDIQGAGTADGTLAYRQLRESDNPYDVKFKEPSGTVTVEDVIPIGDDVQHPPQHRRFRFL
jgi:hypothetical protein